MELDDLKNLWKKQEQHFERRNKTEIAAMLKGTSKSIVSKLKRNVWIELIFTLVAGIILLGYAATLEASAFKTVSIFFLIIFVGYSAYYIKKLRLLKTFDNNTDNIRSSLEKLVTNLTVYLKYYRLSYTILYPVCFGLGILFGGVGMDRQEFADVITETRTVIMLAILAITFYFSSTWLVKWLLRKLYGNHLEKLKTLLTDLDAE